MANTPTNLAAARDGVSPSRPPLPLLPHQMINRQNIPTTYIHGGAGSDTLPPPPLPPLPHQITADDFPFDLEDLFLPHAAMLLQRRDFALRHSVVALPARNAAGSAAEGVFSGDRGLPEEVIARFLETAAADEDDHEACCAVCLDDLQGEDRTVGILRCRHGFHGECIGKWLRRKNACPLCRAIVVE